MILPDDFREFLQCLNAREVRYLVVVPGLIDGVEVAFIAKPDLIANKLAVGRPEDLADVARLRED